MISHEKTSGTFFEVHQKKNVMRLLRDSVEKILNQWLITDDEDHTKLKNLQQLGEKDLETNTFPENQAPDYVIRLWLDPHQALKTLDSKISIQDIRTLIKEAAKEIELVSTHQKAPPYS